MGLPEKYLAYRAASGNRNAGGGGGGLAILMLILMGVAVIAMAVNFLVTSIQDLFRPLVMVSPTLISLLLGAILVLPVFLITPYPPKVARDLIRSSDKGWSMYVKVPIFFGIIGLYGYYAIHSAPVFDGKISSTPFAPYTGATWFIILMDIVIPAYLFYKVPHFLYRTRKLIAYSPYGWIYTILYLLPVGFSFPVGFFDVPTVFDGHDVILTSFFISPLILGAIFIYLSEKHVIKAVKAQEKAEAEAEAESETDAA